MHFNKQAMRDYYKIMHGDWYNAVNEAKGVAAQSGRPFTEVLAHGQKRKDYPPTPEVDKAFLHIQKAKFEMIQSFIKNQGHDLREEAGRIAGTEIDYYTSSGNLEQYEVLNSV